MVLPIALTLTIAMLVAIYTDLTRYIIPNWLNLGLLLLYPVWYMLAPEPLNPLMSLAVFGILLVSGFALFALKVVGGGDVKLLAVCGLYTGWGSASLGFVFYTGLIGGAMSLILIALRFAMPAMLAGLRRKEVTIPRVLTMDEPVPYGLAIALSFLIILWNGEMPGMATLGSNIAGF